MDSAVTQTSVLQFNQIHIDVARNATDDFNLFHDSQQWSRIYQNPFHGPIALGFQIESLIENQILQHRQIHNELEFIQKQQLQFSNYQFNFANAIKPDQNISINIRNTQTSKDGETPFLSNRVSVKADKQLALIGFKKETTQPLFLPDTNSDSFPEQLSHYPDRDILDIVLKGQDKTFFLKRKFMNVSNAKNFLCGSRVDQRTFFDELKNRYQFPEIFPCAFISCALLEKFMLKKLDFERSPMVYTSHKISVDRSVLTQLKSNDRLHILIHLTSPMEKTVPKNNNQIYECYGLIHNNDILFRALVELTPLQGILKHLKMKVPVT